ncbi:BBP7 family outer membrane beta-barrel protein [Allorhodopirellula solitaria]|uniref:Uncharacterized protein n=1 Tax=Allorhodopirellula solitaria TaxID=2527987 RepID=A0A5C5X229_9BACT|nr:BBP7 family outer membrane beta-barrel protein [Allorhodopirellula solitaria]TWT56311.1 hypothetical protein CA85_43140 [Allorhodopirellula solitaria]
MTKQILEGDRPVHHDHATRGKRALPRLARLVLAIACAASPVSAQDDSQTTERRIPIRRYSSPAEPASRVLKEDPGVQPGRVTSVEIRDADGEIRESELEDGEYFMGAAPMPVHVGQSVSSNMASSSTLTLKSPFADAPEEIQGREIYEGAEIIEGEEYPDPNVMFYEPEPGYEGELMFAEPIDGGCAACGESVTGVCDSCRYADDHYGRYDKRVEHLARFLAHPLANFWARAEYANISLDGQGAPPLLTTSDPGTSIGNAGIVGLASTQTLYGGTQIGDSTRSGGRFEVGRYFGASGLGLSGSILFADDEKNHYSANSSTYGILARPYVDVSPGGMGSEADLVGYSGEYSGNVNVLSTTQFAAGDVFLRAMLVSQADRQLESFVGYTYLQLDDDLTIGESKRITGSSSGLAIGTLIDRSDHFEASNRFNAAAFGVRSETRWARWSLASMLKLGVGRTSTTVTARGLTRTTDGSTSIQNGGLLVQESNSGSRDYSQFAVSPELRILLSRQLPYGWSASVGYHFLYLSRVLRAGEQIDPLLNLTQQNPGVLQGLAAPRRQVYYNDLTANAITFGVMRNF